MKVFAVNSSARGRGESMTELMLSHLVAGMHDAGAEVDVVNLREKTVKNCTGCLTCWTKTPGTCIHKDDMSEELLPKLLAANLVVCATPLYLRFMNAAMSAFRERLLPLALPFYEIDVDGKIQHPKRTKGPSAVVWLSVCGFPEESEFDALSYYVNHTVQKGVSLLAEIYRPCARTMLHPSLQDKKTDILDATRQAGRELVVSMKVSDETMARIRQPLLEPRDFVEIGNKFWKKCIAKKATPGELKERKGL
ncbi:MAG: flavodoxin family protein [Deltaproteobacteria bacterium]|nr:flavodoxin family protein [Deltaproteobacteria bacterium]